MTILVGVRILIADDHPLVRFGVRSTLEGAGHTVVGEAESCRETLKLVARHRPELLILDLDMPGGGPEALIRRAFELHPALKLMILSGGVQARHLRMLTRLKMSGYLLKHEQPESLLQAVRVIGEGATWFSHEVSSQMLTLSQMDADAPQQLFTEREHQIFQLIAEGKDNSTIAQELGLADQTVRKHASVIYTKLGVSHRLEAIVWAQEHGWTDTALAATSA
jgi:two-component system, NarL family, invasion response regulator UvrY